MSPSRQADGALTDFMHVDQHAAGKLELKRLLHWQDFASIALLATMGYYMTNWSLLYLDYSTRIVFKSCKVLPVMFLGGIIQKKHYSMAEYLSGGLLVVGITLFTLGMLHASLMTYASAHCVLSATRDKLPCSMYRVWRMLVCL